MQGIGSRLGNLIDDAASSASEFGSEVRSLHVHFFDGIGVGDRVRRPGDRDVVVLDSIDQEVIAARPLAVHCEYHRAVLVDRIVRSYNNSWGGHS